MNSKIAELSASLVKPEQLRRLIARIVAATILLAIAYWGLIASDRYVSEAHVIIQKTDLASGQSMDIGSFLAGSSGNNRADQLLLRDHLLSLDMMNKLDAQLDLRTHYSGWRHDPISALWFRNTSQERMHQYFQNRLSVEFDDYAGVLVIKAQAYDAKTAHAIGTMLVEEGERAMNELAHRLAQEQVTFVEKQVKSARSGPPPTRARASRQSAARTRTTRHGRSRAPSAPQSRRVAHRRISRSSIA
jgi:capsular polysaccharide transport system permease protein